MKYYLLKATTGATLTPIEEDYNNYHSWWIISALKKNFYTGVYLHRAILLSYERQLQIATIFAIELCLITIANICLLINLFYSLLVIYLLQPLSYLSILSYVVGRWFVFKPDIKAAWRFLERKLLIIQLCYLFKSTQ